uniref:Centromere protein X n=1 Tax=Fagus sylvatica TaxID=28930 RepID=A0A2N9EUB4_FAGSY
MFIVLYDTPGAEWYNKCSIRVSNELGSGRPQAAHLIVHVALSMVATKGILVATVMILGRNVWGNCYCKDEEVVIYVGKMLNLVAVGAGTSKKNRQTFANGKAIKLSCELFRIFITEAVQRAATTAEAEGASRIEATHLERILPQLLLDF